MKASFDNGNNRKGVPRWQLRQYSESLASRACAAADSLGYLGEELETTNASLSATLLCLLAEPTNSAGEVRQAIDETVTRMIPSILWISSPRVDREKVSGLRSAGLLPVAVPSTESALLLLRQFRAEAVVLSVRTGRSAWSECARLIAAGSPVVVLHDRVDLESCERYLAAGCAAVVRASCPATELAALLQRIVAGQRGITWPAISMASAAHSPLEVP
jgi:hypothetical protein